MSTTIIDLGPTETWRGLLCIMMVAISAPKKERQGYLCVARNSSSTVSHIKSVWKAQEDSEDEEQAVAKSLTCAIPASQSSTMLLSCQKTAILTDFRLNQIY